MFPRPGKHGIDEYRRQPGCRPAASRHEAVEARIQHGELRQPALARAAPVARKPPRAATLAAGNFHTFGSASSSPVQIDHLARRGAIDHGRLQAAAATILVARKVSRLLVSRSKVALIQGALARMGTSAPT